MCACYQGVSLKPGSAWISEGFVVLRVDDDIKGAERFDTQTVLSPPKVRAFPGISKNLFEECRKARTVRTL
jgi:hypothetical protein